MVYDSAFAREHVDKLFEQYAYKTLEASTQLAKERGPYELFKGSSRSKGILFGRDEKWFAEHSTLRAQRATLIKQIKTD